MKTIELIFFIKLQFVINAFMYGQIEYPMCFGRTKLGRWSYFIHLAIMVAVSDQSSRSFIQLSFIYLFFE